MAKKCPLGVGEQTKEYRILGKADYPNQKSKFLTNFG